MLFDLYDDLVNTPGNTKSLASIADKSREYLEALSQTDQASVDLRLEVAEGYKRLSDVTGNPGRANLGQREKAAIYLETAYKQFQTLHESEPQNQSIKSGLAKTAADFATHKFISEDDNEATRALSSTAIQLYEELIASNVDTFENTRHKLATAQLSARTHIWDGKGDIGISMFQDLLNQSIAFAAKYPENDKAASLNASIHTDYAETISWHYDAVGGDQNEALTLINASIDTYETLSRNDPENTLHPRSLLTVYYKRSQIFYSLEDWGKVRDDLEYAAALAKTFITKDPDDSQITRSLKNIEEQLVPVLGYLGEFERAIALGNENYKKSAALYKSDENNSGRFRELTNAIFAQATIRDIAGLRKEACEFYIMASENWKIIEQTVGITELDRDNMYKEIEENREACQKNEK